MSSLLSRWKQRLETQWAKVGSSETHTFVFRPCLIPSSAVGLSNIHMSKTHNLYLWPDCYPVPSLGTQLSDKYFHLISNSNQTSHCTLKFLTVPKSYSARPSQLSRRQVHCSSFAPRPSGPFCSSSLKPYDQFINKSQRWEETQNGIPLVPSSIPTLIWAAIVSDLDSAHISFQHLKGDL
jgi:hypothetical protein